MRTKRWCGEQGRLSASRLRFPRLVIMLSGGRGHWGFRGWSGVVHTRRKINCNSFEMCEHLPQPSFTARCSASRGCTDQSTPVSNCWHFPFAWTMLTRHGTSQHTKPFVFFCKLVSAFSFEPETFIRSTSKTHKNFCAKRVSQGKFNMHQRSPFCEDASLLSSRLTGANRILFTQKVSRNFFLQENENTLCNSFEDAAFYHDHNDRLSSGHKNIPTLSPVFAT